MIDNDKDMKLLQELFDLGIFSETSYRSSLFFDPLLLVKENDELTTYMMNVGGHIKSVIVTETTHHVSNEYQRINIVKIADHLLSLHFIETKNVSDNLGYLEWLVKCISNNDYEYYDRMIIVGSLKPIEQLLYNVIHVDYFQISDLSLLIA